MRGLHSCREGKDMAGDNFNEKQYYKGKITEIINKCENLNYLEIAYEFLKRLKKCLTECSPCVIIYKSLRDTATAISRCGSAW